jgi:hypothetical protein
MSTEGVELIDKERFRQVMVEGFLEPHDDLYIESQLSMAAESYILVSNYLCNTDCIIPLAINSVIEQPPSFWPWDKSWWKPSEDPIKNLVKAGALIAAEIDRLLRKNKKKQSALKTEGIVQ